MSEGVLTSVCQKEDRGVAERLLQIREFDRERDAGLVRGWWLGHGREPVEPCMWTDFGVVATTGDEDVACAWLYVNNRSPVARVENLVTNPKSDAGDVDRARMLIMDFFQQQAAEIGKCFEVDMPFPQEELPLALVRGDELVDRVEAELVKMEETDMPVTHRFTPGMYVRQIFIPARTLLTSKIHKTEHPYVISQGDISVWTKEGGAVRLRAPHTGITKPGTRRILFAHEDTIWTTFHVTEERDVDRIEMMIIEKRENLFLEGEKPCLG